MVLIRRAVPPSVCHRRPPRFKSSGRQMKMALIRDNRTLRYLSRCFRNAMCRCPNTQQAGVKSLAEASTMENYAICILCLAFDDFVPTRVCLYAAKNFTDHIRNRWSPTSGDIKLIPETEKCEIIDLILAEMSKAPWHVESRLPEALTIIGLDMDLPRALPESGPFPLAQLRKFGVIHKMTPGLHGFGWLN